MKKTFNAIAGLFNGLWPIHLKPLPDELLSSWLIRLAHAHGYKVETLCRLLLGQGAAMWNRDIDRVSQLELLQAVMTATATSELQFKQTTLLAYDGVLSEQSQTVGTGRWLVSLFIFHRTRRKPGLMYCRLCLASDVDPYFRKKWRLACVTVCSLHKVDLEDTCPVCRSMLMPHRVDVGFQSYMPTDKLLIRCHKCGHDLRKGPARSSNDELTAITEKIERCLDDGYICLEPNSSLHSLAFMNGLRLLLRAARRIVNQDAEQGRSKELKKIPNAEFEHLGLSERRRLMFALGEMISVGPLGLANYLRAKSVRFSDVVSLENDTPFWLLNALSPLKRAQHPERSAAELQMIADAVEARAGKMSEHAARELFGAFLAAEDLPTTHRSTVTAETYELLMASMDQDIGATFDQRLKLAYLQDKVIFALLRTTNLTTGHVARMSLEELDFPDDEFAEFETEPRTARQAFAWVKWHVGYIRPKIGTTVHCRKVFVSLFTLRPLGATAIQGRFKSAVERAGLTARIPGLRAYKR